VIFAAVTGVLNTGLLVCGGFDDAAYDYQSACYSLTGGSWKKEPSMLEGRSNAASSIWPGQGLLVTGGSNWGPRLSSTEYLSTSSGQWTSGPALPVEMSDHCQVTVGPDVIITGGRNSYVNLAGAYKLSTDGSWTTLPSLTTARSSHACVVHQGYLVVIGGHETTATRTVEKIKLTSLTKWEAGPGLDTYLYHGQAIVYQDTIFVVNKDDGKVVKLNTEGDNWEAVTDLGRNIGQRPVFPAPIVTPGAIGC